MDRELRILNHNKRNATKIVSRKPSPSEGFNGDIYMGNTPDGIIMYAKVKNKWHGFKPRTAKDSLSTFEGSIYLKNFFISTISGIGGVQDDQGWIILNEKTYHMHRHAENAFQSSWDIGTTQGWQDMLDMPYLLPEDCTIKFIHSVASIDDSYGDSFVPGATSTLYIFSLESGTASWDSSQTSIQLDSPTLVDTAIATIEENHTLFKYELNNERVYPKGSHIAFYIKNVNKDDSEPDHIQQHFILQFEPQEQNI